MATKIPPKKNQALTFYVSLISQSDTNVAQANPTLAAGDVKVAIDDGAPANLATLPTVDADFTKRVKVDLSAAEMNGDEITVIFADVAGAEWQDQTVMIYTAPFTWDELPQYIWDALTSALTTASSIGKLLVDNIDAAISSRSSHNAAGVRTEIDSNSTQLAAIVADTNELQADWANGGRLDLLIDAIKAVTDNLPESGALTTIDANVDSILADTGTDGVAISTATAQAIADEMLKRGISNVEDTADTLSLAALVLATLESSISGTTWTIRKSDGTTFTTKTLTIDSNANPVVGVT